jgi:hypothetical protein
MLSDPQGMVINGTTHSFALTKPGVNQNVYEVGNGFSMTTKQNVTSTRFRREVRLSSAKTAADPISTVNKEIGASVYLVIDEPKWGFSDEEIGWFIEGLKSWLISANYNKLLGGQY